MPERPGQLRGYPDAAVRCALKGLSARCCRQGLENLCLALQATRSALTAYSNGCGGAAAARSAGRQMTGTWAGQCAAASSLISWWPTAATSLACWPRSLRYCAAFYGCTAWYNLLTDNKLLRGWCRGSRTHVPRRLTARLNPSLVCGEAALLTWTGRCWRSW